MTTLPVSLQNALHDIVERTNLAGASIRSILLSTTEGVPLGRCIIDTDVMDYSNTNNNSNVESSSAVSMNEEVISSIESIWSPASKQFPVFGLQKLKQVTAIYDHGILFQIYQTPLVRVSSNKNLHLTHLFMYTNIYLCFIFVVHFFKISLAWHSVL